MTRRQHLMAWVVFPDSIHVSDEGDLVYEEDPVDFTPKWLIPCRGCGEHFMITYGEVVEMTKVKLDEMIHHRLWCFRCKRRREAEAAAARGQIQ